MPHLRSSKRGIDGLILVLCMIVVALVHSACGLPRKLYGGAVLFGGSHRVEWRIADDLNDNYPVAVDLLVIYKKSLDGELSELSAQEWFAQRAQYLRDHGTSEFEVFRWEWVPGQPAPPQPFVYRSGARSAIVFVSYASPGEHRVRLEAPNRSLRVHLNASDFTAETI